MEKKCSQCGETKSLDEFAIQATGKMGRRADCKVCVKRFIRSKRGLAKTIYGQQKAKSKKRQYALPTYTEEELYVWLIRQSNFQQLYDIWVLSDYATKLKPSVDRINDRISYRLDNIQLRTMQQNVDRYYKDAKAGINNKQNKAVDMLDKDGNFIQRFHSASAAARQFNGIPTNIIGACTGRVSRKKEVDGSYRKITQLTAYGYKWRYSTIPNKNGEIL